MSSDALVYVIDDDPSLRRALARLVAAAGYDVETFPSAEAFLGQPVTDRPACLVLDVRLPGESGLDLQTALGSARRFLPIIFVTGHGTVSAGIRAMKGGAVDFLEKPVDEKELLGGIRQALRQSREARAALTEQDELMLMTSTGQSIRIRVSQIRETGRVAQGVKLLTLKQGEKLQDISRVIPDGEDAEAPATDAGAEPADAGEADAG